ncbi:MAG: ATP-binding protein [Pirellulales bacterium]|nr:ATP-binding protein [Pirellulales bacterium]
MSTILIVDDSAVDRRLAGGILEKTVGLKVEYAFNGVEGLEKIPQVHPEMVLTDMQMPEMDGLDLVGKIRERFPLVPVVLMTAHGSEELAVQALARGAASYVPKAKLADELPEVVSSVLAVAKADRHNERLGACLKSTTSEFVLENDPALVDPLVDQCQQLITRMKICDETDRIRIGVALEEALLNALYHGNLELDSESLREARTGMVSGSLSNPIDLRRKMAPYVERKIHVRVSVSSDAAQFSISDEGPGFNLADVPDCTEPENLERECGRGLLLMRTFMDEVRFSPKGNEVTLIKRKAT